MDTEIGGVPIAFEDSNKEDRLLENEFALCSRTFKNRRGDFRSPRNVFLHGRGGAKSLNCLYRFEANLGEQVIIFYFKKSSLRDEEENIVGQHYCVLRIMRKIQARYQYSQNVTRCFNILKKLAGAYFKFLHSSSLRKKFNIFFSQFLSLKIENFCNEKYFDSYLQSISVLDSHHFVQCFIWRKWILYIRNRCTHWTTSMSISRRR